MTEQDYAEERSSGSRKRRSRSSSRSPRGSRHRHHRHDDGFYHDTLVVTGLSKDATEETVRQAFVPFGSLKRVSLVTDEVGAVFRIQLFSPLASLFANYITPLRIIANR
uniref:RRM domain-containing protein n=1 Tax=Spongospora subterranea TaxID=70186 RepID=A0A0H5R6I8_9EUKA|eukprot:CRZ09382.1 hypothetical protein [Spongospora subterranea]